MSTYLWKYYLEDDFEKFKTLLATATYSSTQSRPSYAGTLSSSAVDSPGKPIATSPLARAKGKATRGGKNTTTITLTRTDINSRDIHGVTLLHLMASSKAENATAFGLTLLELPMLDLYIQDLESGWTALHRALYSGNVLLARAIMDRDISELQTSGGASHAGGLIKIKDHEGNSPFDVYATTIAVRIIPRDDARPLLEGQAEDSDNDDDMGDNDNRSHRTEEFLNVDGDEVFAFGSNKNLTLGFGDEDDRQFPERIFLKRPQYLLDMFHQEHITKLSRKGENIETESLPTELPASVDFKSIKIQDMQLSKLHTAILTTDPESNLFICGFGKGGRLGTGDESTRFNFTNVSAGGLQKRKVTAVALGQNHTIAVTKEGEAYTWGNNSFGQLGYTLPNQTSQDSDPMQLFPRQLFGLLKKEFVVGCAASRTHSVLFTNTSLYTFGKQDGQLGISDSDAGSIDMQPIPRKVAAALITTPIAMVTAIDKATACLLENHEVWVFANYGYARVTFPLDGFSQHHLRGTYSSTHYDKPNYIAKICSGGDTICALAREGDVYTVNVSQKIDPSAGSSSTTNPSKIRGGLSQPQRIWSLRKEHMAVRDVDVGQDGSVIICTNAGSVWRRVKRAKIKDANSVTGASEYKPKDYKFSRVPGLTRVAAVRSNAFGGFAAIRRDCDVLRTQVNVDPKNLWQDLFPLLVFCQLSSLDSATSKDTQGSIWLGLNPARIRQALLQSKDIESDMESLLKHRRPDENDSYDVTVGSTSSILRFPCHKFLLMARSPVLRRGFQTFQEKYYFELPGHVVIEYDQQGKPSVLFPGIDLLTLINFVLYLYTDNIVSFWNFTRQRPQLAFRYREVRVEVMKLAQHLDMRSLEHAARLMTEPGSTMNKNMDMALLDPSFFNSGDIEVELVDVSVKVHSALVCRRCPFFEGLFHGRAGGGWLSSRREQDAEEIVKVDLQHVNKDTFDMVLRHLYADAGEEIFEDLKATDLETFLDVVLDVMGVANELMIDRLAQVCQRVIGSYVNTRNVCWLLNAIAPCSVTEFKHAALEYICLNLEGMLENNLLDELDEDLMVDLDKAISDNQLASMPVAKSGRAEEELLDRYPELLEIMEKNKNIKIDSMAIRSHFHEDEAKMAKYSVKSPMLRAKSSVADMMFNMDEDDIEISSHSKAPSTPPTHLQQNLDGDHWDGSPSASLPREDVWFDSHGKQLSPTRASVQGRSINEMEPSTSSALEDQDSPSDIRSSSRKYSDASPWAEAPLSTSKLSMKQIMAQTSEGRTSNISSAFSKSMSPATASPSATTKMSQKDRKRMLHQQQQQQLQMALDAAQGTSEASSTSKSSPWQKVVSAPKVSLKDDLLGAPSPPGSLSPSPSSSKRRPSPGPSLTMRQTIPGNQKQQEPKEESSSSARTTQQRSVSSPAIENTSTTPVRPSPQPRQSNPVSPPVATPSSSSPIVPRSVRHNTGRPAAEPSLQISITDILNQQQIEKDLIKEATAKRSLQEIQEEQAFQEWWDAEEAKTKARLEQEEVATKASGNRNSSRGGRAGGRGRGKGRGTGPGAGAGSSTSKGKGKAERSTTEAESSKKNDSGIEKKRR